MKLTVVSWLALSVAAIAAPLYEYPVHHVLFPPSNKIVNSANLPDATRLEGYGKRSEAALFLTSNDDPKRADAALLASPDGHNKRSGSDAALLASPDGHTKRTGPDAALLASPDGHTKRSGPDAALFASPDGHTKRSSFAPSA